MRRIGPGTGIAAKGMRGFTLNESIMVIGISALLLGTALPGMLDITARVRAGSVMLELRGLLERARQTAISRATEVTVCGSVDGEHCASRWDSSPIYVFIDRNRDRNWGTSDERIASSALRPGERIVWRGSGGRRYLRFNAAGGVQEYGTFTYCPTPVDPRFLRQITLNMVGRPRTVDLTPSAAARAAADICS